MMTPYQMEVNNIARFIHDNPAGKLFPVPIDAFQCAMVLTKNERESPRL